MIAIRKKYQKPLIIISIVIILLITIAVFYCFKFFYNPNNGSDKPQIDKSVLENLKLKDNKDIYKEEDLYEVNEVYLTVFSGYDIEAGKSYDFDQMNQINSVEQDDPVLKAIVQLKDNETGQFYVGKNEIEPNCEISLRGQSARRKTHKSYKIKLFNGKGSFEGQSTLNLNKHVYDESKMKQKFCFDYMTKFEDMVSLRTNFMRLYIRDATKNEIEYKDYGIYTHVEQPNKDFLRTHNLDPNGSLYKPSDFEFYYDDRLKAENDENYNYDEFSKLLRIKENSDNESLIEMVKAVNDYTIDFNTTFDKYFDVDNYLTWLAMNIIFNNYDTMSRNFMLYSPSYSEKWYFIPWDYDGTLKSIESIEKTPLLYNYSGIARYWGTILHNRFLRNPENIELLDQKMDEIYHIVNKETTHSMTDKYINDIIPLFQNDFDRISDADIQIMKNEVDSFSDIIDYNYNIYFSSKDKPMPFFLGAPTQVNGENVFNWSPSYDLLGDKIFYKFQIIDNIETSNVIYEKDNIYANQVIFNEPIADGKYFFKVTVSDDKGNTQIAYDRYKSGIIYFGYKAFEIKDNKVVTN